MSGTQPVARTSSLSRSCGTNCIRPQLSALSSSACRVRIGVRVPWISERTCSSPATATTSSWSLRTMLTTATPKPTSSVTPSAISWRPSRKTVWDQLSTNGSIERAGHRLVCHPFSHR